MSSFKDRIIRAARLDVHLYEEVEKDATAMNQAMAVVVLSSVAAGLANFAKAGVGGILIGILISLIGWFVWAYLTYFIGTRILPEPQTHTNPGELLRTIGFSSAPGLVRIVGIIPGLSGVIFIITSIWMLVAMVVAVKQALDYHSTARAVGVCVIGWIIQILIITLVFSLFLNTVAQSP